MSEYINNKVLQHVSGMGLRRKKLYVPNGNRPMKFREHFSDDPPLRYGKTHAELGHCNYNAGQK